MDITKLAGLLREAEKHHGQYEPTAPPHRWSDWYAAYIIAREQSRPEDRAAAEASQHMVSVLR